MVNLKAGKHNGEPFELLVIGAGPHALSLMSKLMEPYEDKWAESSANPRLFSSDAKGRVKVKTSKHEAVSDLTRREVMEQMFSSRAAAARRAGGHLRPADLLKKVAVVDKYGAWLVRWESYFQQLGIKWLRSTRMLHPDPLHQDALHVFSEQHGRTDEWLELHGLLRTNDFHGPFHAPSSALFMDHCRQIVARYGLDRVVRRGEVVAVEQVEAGDSNKDEQCGAGGRAGVDHKGAGSKPQTDHQQQQQLQLRPLYRVRLSDGSTLLARRVVVAPGCTDNRRVPDWAQELMTQVGGGAGSPGGGAVPNGRISHVHDMVSRCCDLAALLRDEVSTNEVGLGRRQGEEGPGVGGSRRPRKGRSLRPGHMAYRSPGGDGHGSCTNSSTKPVGRPGDVGAAGKASNATAPPAERSHGHGRVCMFGPAAPGERLLVVGGGLTSVQLALRALEYGFAQVHLVARHELQVKQFDIGTEWMGGSRFHLLAKYWSLPIGERRLALAKARGQASVPPEAMDQLRRAMVEAGGQGGSGGAEGGPGLRPRLLVDEECEVQGAWWVQPGSTPLGDEEEAQTAAAGVGSISSAASLELAPAQSTGGGGNCSGGGGSGGGSGGKCECHAAADATTNGASANAAGGRSEHSGKQEQQGQKQGQGREGAAGHFLVQLSSVPGQALEYDRVWLATGSAVDVRLLGFLDPLMRAHPVDVIQGLPVLQEDLRWAHGVDVHVMGPYAGLQLGPDALNLAGARSGAATIAAALRRAAPDVFGGTERQRRR